MLEFKSFVERADSIKEDCERISYYFSELDVGIASLLNDLISDHYNASILNENIVEYVAEVASGLFDTYNKTYKKVKHISYAFDSYIIESSDLCLNIAYKAHKAYDDIFTLFNIRGREVLSGEMLEAHNNLLATIEQLAEEYRQERLVLAKQLSDMRSNAYTAAWWKQLTFFSIIVVCSSTVVSKLIEIAASNL